MFHQKLSHGQLLHSSYKTQREKEITAVLLEKIVPMLEIYMEREKLEALLERLIMDTLIP